MCYFKNFRSSPDTFNDNSIVNLILAALNNNRFTLERYKLLMNMTKDVLAKEQIKYTYKNEVKHYKLFNQIYRELTGESVEIPEPDIKINDSLEDTIEECINKELKELNLYRRIRNLTRSEILRRTIGDMIIDKQRNTAVLNFVYARHSLSRNPASPANDAVTIQFKSIKEKKKYIDENLKIPILSGIKNKKIQNQINASVEGDIMEFKHQMEEAADEDGAKAKKDGKKFINYSISNNSTITYNKNNIISISILYYEFVGGRHFYIRSTYNFDTNTGKSIGLKDLFQPGVPYKELINKEIKNELMSHKEEFSSDAAENFKGIVDGQPFYLEDGNIVLFFGFNEIAPTIAEIPIIKIPFSAFKGSINPIFLS